MLPTIHFENNAWMAYILSYANKICYLNEFLSEWDRRRGISLSVLICSRPVQAVYEDIKGAIIYFLDNGNPEKMTFLKEAALAMASHWERSYNYMEYGKLRDEIEANY